MKDMNQFLGAWITAGVALGGVIFAAIQAIANAIAKGYSTKSNNETKIRLAKNAEKDKQRQAINRKYEYIQKTFSDYLSYTASILNSHNIQNLDKQTDAFGRIIPLTKQARNVVFYIQSEIGKGNYDNAMDNFESIIDTLSKEETSLLSQLEQHLPKDCKDDSED
ncbi:hypothetical protein [Limosilactobacillus reuteri]|uniref:hypothetical protein n=1 Tax=Limosilactobacillus reuteri TaxID=1598 RepID=UPI002B055171|nr:hypothetical protein [Limosilactobacillus reuteri]